MYCSSSVYKQKPFKTNVYGFDVRGQQEMDFFTGASVIDYELKNALMDLFLTNMKLYISHDFYLRIIVMFLSAVWTLILTAPIHAY